MQHRIPPFVRYGIVPRIKGREPKFRYDLKRSLLLEIALTLKASANADPKKNPAIVRLARDFQTIADDPSFSNNISGRSFSITEIDDIYIRLTINASLLKAVGIDLKGSKNRAVASFGLCCLTDYDGWLGQARTA